MARPAPTARPSPGGRPPQGAPKAGPHGRPPASAAPSGGRGTVLTPDDPAIRHQARNKKKKHREEPGARAAAPAAPPRGARPERADRSERGRRNDRRDRDDRGQRRNKFGKPLDSRRSRPVDPSTDTSDYTRLKATIDKNKRGFAFLQFENRDYEDAFLPPREADRYFHGDRVEALVSPQGEVIELNVLEHRFREVVGRYYPIGESGTIVYERKKAREEIPVHGDAKGAKSRDWVRAKMIYPEGGHHHVLGEIQKVYGPELPSEADIGMVAAEYSLVEHHSEKAVQEAESYRLDLADPHRVDLRHLPFITIDGETARDFDDAVYVEREGDGYVLWVAIADVSHYVKEGTTLDDEAYSRATSVYFPERAFHMLPRALSENLCSLRPKEPRLTMTAKIHLDAKGRRQRVEVLNTIIDSRRRATYNEIQAEWDANGKDPSWEYAVHFELYRLIRAQRNQRGSIDFDLPEAEIRVDEAGEPISIKQRPRLDAHRLIEEFMISANESVSEWALSHGAPFIFRVHDEPAPAALQRFQDLCAHHGINLVVDPDHVAESLNGVIRALDGHPAQTVLNMALLRSMPQAKYSAAHSGHFGLASGAYSHFTSPIRRYPDLIAHRVLKDLIEFAREQRKPPGDWVQEWNEKLEEMAEHCSYRERIAADAERESIKLKQIRIMMKEVGNEFDGKVNGMMESGIFIGLDDPFVEGLIPKEGLHDDQYEFVEERMLYLGRRKKRQIHIGDRVKVRVARVDFDLRTIDFELLEHTNTHAPKPFTMPERSEKRRPGGRPGGGPGGRHERGGRPERGGGRRGKKRGRR